VDLKSCEKRNGRVAKFASQAISSEDRKIGKMSMHIKTNVVPVPV
jgi:hypothetical protein